MEEIDLKEILTYFWNKKFIIVIISLISLLIGVVYTEYIQVPMYKSYTTILLTKENDETTITANDVMLNQKLVNTYREIIKSRNVMNRVINNLDLDYSVEQLSNNVSVTSVNETEIIKITVQDTDRRLARDITNEIARVFNSEVIKLYNIQNIGVVDKAEIAKNPFNISIVKQLIIALFIGIVLGFGIVFVIYYFDNTVKNVEEVERKLKLPVIGQIPHTGGKSNV